MRERIGWRMRESRLSSGTAWPLNPRNPVPPCGPSSWFIRHFPGKDVPVRKKVPPSRKSEAIVTHAAPGVNGHGIHGIHGPLITLNVLGFPTSRSYPTGGGLRVHESRKAGLGEDKNN